MTSKPTRRERMADLAARVNAANQQLCDRYQDATDPAERREIAGRTAILLRRFGRLTRSIDRPGRHRP